MLEHSKSKNFSRDISNWRLLLGSSHCPDHLANNKEHELGVQKDIIFLQKKQGVHIAWAHLEGPRLCLQHMVVL